MQSGYVSRSGTLPDVPADRRGALREASAKARRDAALVAEAKKCNLQLNPVGWQAQQDAIRQILAADQRVVDRLKTILVL